MKFNRQGQTDQKNKTEKPETGPLVYESIWQGSFKSYWWKDGLKKCFLLQKIHDTSTSQHTQKYILDGLKTQMWKGHFLNT